MNDPIRNPEIVELENKIDDNLKDIYMVLNSLSVATQSILDTIKGLEEALLERHTAEKL